MSGVRHCTADHSPCSSGCYLSMRSIHSYLGLWRIALRRFISEPILTLCLLVGWSVVVALASAPPMYSDAANRSLLQNELQTMRNRSAFSFFYHYVRGIQRRRSAVAGLPGAGPVHGEQLYERPGASPPIGHALCQERSFPGFPLARWALCSARPASATRIPGLYRQIGGARFRCRGRFPHAEQRGRRSGRIRLYGRAGRGTAWSMCWSARSLLSSPGCKWVSSMSSSTRTRSRRPGIANGWRFRYASPACGFRRHPTIRSGTCPRPRSPTSSSCPQRPI